MSKFIIRPGADIIGRLKSAGYSTYRLQRGNIIGQSTLTKYRRSGLPSWNELSKLCDLLHASPVDLIAFQADDGTVTTFDSVPPVALVSPHEPLPASAIEPEPMPDTATDDAVTVTLSPSQLRNMDGAISCNYAQDRVQYVQRAIDAQIQRDIEEEMAKRRRQREAAFYASSIEDSDDDDGTPGGYYDA